MIPRTPLTIVLVYSPGCPHCHTYMPIWKELCKKKNRQANLVSMEATTYDRTPMSKSKPVNGVPSVLFVDSQGQITEARNIRDKTAMSNVVRSANTENMTEPIHEVANIDLNTETESPMVMSPMSMSPMSMSPMVSSKDSLHPLPGYVVPSQRGGSQRGGNLGGGSQRGGNLGGGSQRGGNLGGGSQRGGNPWAAFLASAAASAAASAPAAALLGAYSMLPERSSGLPRPLRSRPIRSRPLRSRRSNRRTHKK
jgi:thiol-disulfide isomerase/thioredoxin